MQGGVVGVELLERIQHATLGTATHARRTLKVENRISRRPKDGALVGRRHVTTGPVFGSRNWASNRIQHHRKAREVLTGCAQAVIDPRAQARATRKDLARVHLQHGRTVDGRVGGQ